MLKSTDKFKRSSDFQDSSEGAAAYPEAQNRQLENQQLPKGPGEQH